MRHLATTALLLAAGLGCGTPAAVAQHATAFDVEDGGRRYQTACATCHGPDGDLIPGIDFGRGVYRRAFTDEQLAAIIQDGLPNTPMPPAGISAEQAQRIVAYLRSMPAMRSERVDAGDPMRGREIFNGKGLCTDCHRAEGRGARTGPDLSGIGLLRRATEIEQSLLDPGAVVLPANRYYAVTSANGERVTGRLLNHDSFSVQLIDADERLRSLSKTDAISHGFTDPAMPSVRGMLNAQEIADVVAYLVSLQGVTAQ